MNNKLQKICEEVKQKSERVLGPKAYRDAEAKRIKPEKMDDMRSQ